MLVNLSEILTPAKNGKYAVGLFNMLNLETARGIIEAAEEEKSPIILGIAEVHLPIIPFEYASLIMRNMAENASVPVCLHFDHGVSFEKIVAALKAGFSSVMFDGSSLDYAENASKSAEIVKIAHAVGASVEAELGHVGGCEDGSDDGFDTQYTKPKMVPDFVAKSGADALAVAIGTAHGEYKTKPVLDIARLVEINKISDVPLVLHGGSGLSETDIKNTILNGICKINICTELCAAADKAYRETAGFENAVTAAKNAVKEVATYKMRLFGSSGRA